MDVRKFYIKPAIPENMKALAELAFNMWTYWDKEAQKLFHRLDPQLFRSIDHNPVELLYSIAPEKLKDASKDKGFLFELKQIHEKFKAYMDFEGNFATEGKDTPFTDNEKIIYLCLEYGIHESIPLYSGGLAILAGDYLKAASDMGLPMVGFGLLYKYGYFSQHISADGTQVETFSENKWYLSPVKEVIDAGGNAMVIEIPIKTDKVFAKIWKIDVGCVPLYLLDTNIHLNPPAYRKITHMLYDDNRETRLEQELILGRGSVIAAKLLGIKPSCYHMNEGHTAFCILQRMLDLTREYGISLSAARNIIKYSTVFTTHTPVVEGNEHFTQELISEYLNGEVKALGLTMKEFLQMGKLPGQNLFWLPAFAINHSRFNNGVSKLHATVARGMWRELFPTMHDREIPIEAITNGVHLQTWLSLQMTDVFNRYIGPDYLHKGDSADVWDKIDSIPDGEIWNAHVRRKEQVISFLRRRVTDMVRFRGYCRHKIKDPEQLLNPEVLTIGFARRFAEYKRADLILSDPERLVKILTNPKKPVQLVFAGKAHPADGIGKGLIKKIVNFINTYPVENHVVFLEDYDMNIARHLVEGVDVWLNNPVRPMEASGTSGMKAGINGVLNFSVLDGWWPEAYDEKNGWAITAGLGADNLEIGREAEANQIYEILENQITTTYYKRTENNLPVEWIKMMKHSMETICRNFNMHRAAREYLDKFYIPVSAIRKKISENDFAALKEIEGFKKQLDAIWPKIFIKDYFTSITGEMPVSGEEVTIDCYVYLDFVSEELLGVEGVYCYGDNYDSIKTIPLTYVEKYEDKVAKFSGKFTLGGTGAQELTVRLVPANANFREIHPEYVKWKE